MKVSTKIKAFEPKETSFLIQTDAGMYKILFLRNDIVRIRCTFEEEFPEESSYTLLMTAWDDRMDELLQKERRRVEPYAARWEEQEGCYLIKSDRLTVVAHKDPFGFDVYDENGRLLMSDVKEKAYVRDDAGRVYHYTSIKEDDCFYGFGEKTGHLNKFRRRMRMNNMDTLGYDAEHSDPLYKHIPFYIKMDRDSAVAAGFFYHNSYPSVFDMGCERSGYWRRYSYFCAEGGEIDLFILCGPTLSKVVETYTDLTGKTAMPPLYSLGYMGSTMYYTELDENSDQAILGFVEKAEANGIPCDGFHMSSGYTTGEDGKRYVFNWNYKRFPDPAAFVKKMKEKGISLSPNVKPGMLLSHPLYSEFSGNGAFIQDAEGQTPHVDRYWGGKASFVDFTNPKARELWKKHMTRSLLSIGIHAIWNDNCEFEINNPSALCHNEGNPVPVEALRPILPNLMALVARQAIEESDSRIRPYILNRAGFAGIQRYAQTWAGDNYTSWKSLKFNIPILLGMGLSGVANQGIDVGGFDGPAPEPELLVRWVQNAVFYPRFCIHSCNADNTVTEPWMYPSYTHYIREAMKLRYRIIPYLYSLMHEAAERGLPVMRPLVFEFQHDKNVYEESFDFMCGPHLLVAGVFEKGMTSREVYLPEGTEWYDWYTRRRYAGGQSIVVDTPMERIPLFFRSGSIIPMSNPRRNIQTERVDRLDILIEPWQSSTFVLYEDDGCSTDYLKGAYLKTAIATTADRRGITVTFDSTGNYKSEIRQITLEVVCRERAPLTVTVAGSKIKLYLDRDEWEHADTGFYYDAEVRSVFIKYVKPESGYRVDVNFEAKDLISI